MSLFDLDGLDRELGLLRIRSIDASRASIDYRVDPHRCHSGGIAQGGFVCAWIDAAMSRVLRAKYGADALTLTLEIKVSFLGPARPGAVTAEAWLLSGSRSIAFVEGHLLDEQGQAVAKASATFKIKLPPREG